MTMALLTGHTLHDISLALTMSYQVITLGSNPHIKVGQCNLVGGKGVQTARKSVRVQLSLADIQGNRN